MRFFLFKRYLKNLNSVLNISKQKLEYMYLVTLDLGKYFYVELWVEGNSKEIGHLGNGMSQQNV